MNMLNLIYQKLLMEYVDNFELVYFLRVKPIILNSGLDAVLHVILI